VKKILNEWKIFLRENLRFEIDKEKLLDKVRDIFFGAYEPGSDEYKSLQDEEFQSLYTELTKRVEGDPRLTEKDKATILSNANIGLTLYWSDESRRGYGNPHIVKKIIQKKLNILETRLSSEELEYLKNEGLQSVLKMVSSDRGGMVFPADLAVGLGVINGQKVLDAFMTTSSAINNHLIPVLGAEGYQVQKSAPKQNKRKKHAPPMSPEEMMAQMKKFGNK